MVTESTYPTIFTQNSENKSLGWNGFIVQVKTAGLAGRHEGGIQMECNSGNYVKPHHEQGKEWWVVGTGKALRRTE